MVCCSRARSLLLPPPPLLSLAGDPGVDEPGSVPPGCVRADVSTVLRRRPVGPLAPPAVAAVVAASADSTDTPSLSLLLLRLPSVNPRGRFSERPAINDVVACTSLVGDGGALGSGAAGATGGESLRLSTDVALGDSDRSSITIASGITSNVSMICHRDQVRRNNGL